MRPQTSLDTLRWILATIAAIALIRDAGGVVAAIWNGDIYRMPFWMAVTLGVFAALELRRNPHWAAIVATWAASYADSLLDHAGWQAGGAVSALVAPTLWLVALEHPVPLNSKLARVVTGFTVAFGFLVYSGALDLVSMFAIPNAVDHWLLTAPLSGAALCVMYFRCRSCDRPLASPRGRLILCCALPIGVGLVSEVLLVTTGVMPQKSVGSPIVMATDLMLMGGVWLILLADFLRHRMVVAQRRAH